MGIGDDASGWCVLRTAAPSTVRLTAWLQEAGYEAWTPMDTIKRRVPRGKSSEYVTAPLTPTFVFVRAGRIEDLKRLEKAIGRHPRFSIFRYYLAIVHVSHMALHPLRAQQQEKHVASLPVVRHYKKPRAVAYDVGDQLKLTSGAFAGLTCTVEDSDGLTTTLALTLFGRHAGLQIATSQLRSDKIEAELIAA